MPAHRCRTCCCALLIYLYLYFPSKVSTGKGQKRGFWSCFSVPCQNIFWGSLFSALVLLFGPLSDTSLHDHNGGYDLHSWSRSLLIPIMASSLPCSNVLCLTSLTAAFVTGAHPQENVEKRSKVTIPTRPTRPQAIPARSHGHCAREVYTKDCARDTAQEKTALRNTM